MVPFAYFGIKSSTLSLVVDLLIVFVAILYVALIYWTVSDARRRIEDPLLIGCAFLASLFPFVGAIVYMILRPPEFLEDARERELEVRAAEARLAQLDRELCPHCDYRIERDFLRCPSCLRKLKERCAGCSRPLDPAWTICPYCETEVPGLAPSRSRRRRSRLEQDEPQESPVEPAPPRDRRPRREESAARASRRRSRDGVLERDVPREGRGALDSEVIAAPEVTLVDESLLSSEDLLGQTIEADQLPPSEDDPARLPATDSGSRPRDPARRSRRTRPGP